jgi:hypothetical protein
VKTSTAITLTRLGVSALILSAACTSFDEARDPSGPGVDGGVDDTGADAEAPEASTAKDSEAGALARCSFTSAGGACVIECQSQTCGPFAEKRAVCPSGRTCVVRCKGVDACAGVEAICAADQVCGLDCIGDTACAGISVVASTTKALCISTRGGTGITPVFMAQSCAAPVPPRCKISCGVGTCGPDAGGCGTNCEANLCDPNDF